MVATAGSAPLRRALVAFGVLALLYGVISEIGSRTLPRRVWLVSHYIEDVELTPRYASLAEEAVFLVRSGILGASILVSGGRVLGGVLLGALVGVPLGLAMARARALGSLLEPWVAFFRFTPAFALLPLYVLWFGFGEGPRVGLIATGVAVVTLHGAAEGARRVPGVYLDAAAALGAGRRLVLARVVLPATLPSLISSVRIATALAWVTAVVAELINPTMPSLGYLLALAGAYPRVPTLAVTLLAVGTLVLVSDWTVLAAYRRATRWMRRRRA
jgi:ABC-type nitrate/sulfonate/bicarbonate transport system permease component